MKKKLLFALLACAAMPFATSCSDDDDNEKTVTFELVDLGDNGYVSAQDIKIYNEIVFKTDTSYGSAYPMGFYVSSLTDKETEGYTNMYSVYNTAGNGGSKKFAIFNTMSSPSDLAAIEVVGADGAIHPKYAYFNLTTYTYLSAVNGDDFEPAFGDGDYFTVTLDGFRGGSKTGSVDVNAIDYRNGKKVAFTDWTFVDLSALGDVDAIKISMSGSQTGEWGLNTPAYIAIDDFTYED